MAGDRLQRVADAVPGAVVDDERRAAVAGDARGRGRRRWLRPRGRPRRWPRRGGRGSGRRGRRRGAGRPRRGRPRPTWRSRQSASARWNWRIGRASKNSLATRRSGPAGRSSDAARPSGGPRRRARRPGRRAGAGLVSTSQSSAAVAEARLPGGGAQGVAHQRAAAGAELGEDAGAAAAVGPGLGQPEADELAEHLADLGGGGEVAGGAERVAGGVVAGEAEPHPGVEAERAGGLDAGAELGRERGHARRAESRMRSRPTASIGSDRSWPMVRPHSAPRATTWPCGLPGVTNWASAWRKPSTAMRARA